MQPLYYLLTSLLRRLPLSRAVYIVLAAVAVCRVVIPHVLLLLLLRGGCMVWCCRRVEECGESEQRERSRGEQREERERFFPSHTSQTRHTHTHTYDTHRQHTENSIPSTHTLTHLAHFLASSSLASPSFLLCAAAMTASAAFTRLLPLLLLFVCCCMMPVTGAYVKPTSATIGVVIPLTGPAAESGIKVQVSE